MGLRSSKSSSRERAESRLVDKKSKQYQCNVVNESVVIRLKNRRVGGFDGVEQRYVQCNQDDCQYVNVNAPPCPLSVAMFATEAVEPTASEEPSDPDEPEDG